MKVNLTPKGEPNSNLILVHLSIRPLSDKQNNRKLGEQIRTRVRLNNQKRKRAEDCEEIFRIGAAVRLVNE